ncbi:helix-turn-helix transcriptional regulator [Chitinophaga nivalis]|uniref:Helix-turn-helix transcriptional regulator n=1 Tax=Chitinophaga nivalis TaxID=2991709 RepID=A0ABT3ING6_9BACT|nr:helix-turn-helix transcriptional regulator [Chitinophaga nivalis]MCW3464786.1 helix-turn-helix transcriptional regulator [Chitinophaga nivalis]MCW3485523.1 helix-turn-helix transcriptional regulator [Chitinophaga nivalis]
MDYIMTIDASNYHIGAGQDKPFLEERVEKLTDNNGFEIELDNVFLDGIHLKSGKYTTDTSKYYAVHPEKETIVAHFCLRGSCISEHKDYLTMQRGECILFREEKEEYLFEMGTDNGVGAFFEISFCPELFTPLFLGENEIIDGIMDGRKLFAHLSQQEELQILINDIHHKKERYTGKLKKLYLESKVAELLITQMSCLQEKKETRRTKLLSRDIEAIYHAKEMISKDMEHLSIPCLALSIGINQTKLKSGFKELFGKTVFEYLTSLRMTKARDLLLSTDHPIADIANIVGYKYAQHFIVAFRKTFGYTPGELRMSNQRSPLQVTGNIKKYD